MITEGLEAGTREGGRGVDRLGGAGVGAGAGEGGGGSGLGESMVTRIAAGLSLVRRRVMTLSGCGLNAVRPQVAVIT